MRCHKSGCSFDRISGSLGINGRSFQNIPEDKLIEERAREGFRRIRASHVAKRILDNSCERHHPYLDRKGFHGRMFRTIDLPRLRNIMPIPKMFNSLKVGTKLGSGLLLVVPLANDKNQITSVQLISPSGDKYFLSGGRVKGSYHSIGNGATMVLCEGVATGLSIYRAAEAEGLSVHVLACMSALNMAFIAKSLKQRGIRSFAVADNDPSGVGIKAASVSNRFVMPSRVGMDFNDLEQEDPVGARILLRGMFDGGD